jgi:hypothetical protein
MNPKAHKTMIMLPTMIHVGELGRGTVCWFMGSANEYPRSAALILSKLLRETSALRLTGIIATLGRFGVSWGPRRAHYLAQ